MVDDGIDTAPATADTVPSTSRGAHGARVRSRNPKGLAGAPRHVPALDGLRGAAVVAVLLYHGGHLIGGYLGVDLFFVLSGYLITGLLLREWGRTRAIKLSSFWARRARRLLPALMIAMIGVSLYAWTQSGPLELNQIRGDGLAALFYVANWHSIFGGTSYFQASLGASPLRHTWSLAIEEQFYVLWPLVVLAAIRLRKRPSTVLALSVIITVLSGGLTIVLHLTGAASDNALYLSTATRVAAITAGAGLAAWHVRRGRVTDPRARLALETGAVVALLVLLVLWSTVRVESGFLYSGGLLLAGLTALVVIASAVQPDAGPVASVLSWPPLRAIGLISYGLYLYHWPIFLYLNERRTGLHGWFLFGAQVAASLVAATVSFLLIERPVRHGAIRNRLAGALLPVASGLVILVLLLATAGAQTLPSDRAGLISGERWYYAKDRSAPRLLVVGDSVAYFLTKDAIRPDLNALHVSVAGSSAIGCNPMLSVGKLEAFDGAPRGKPLFRDCSEQWPASEAKLKPDVVMVMLGSQPDYRVQIDGSFVDACAPRFGRAFESWLTRAARAFTRRGAQVVLATTVPITASRAVHSLPLHNTERVDCLNGYLRDVADREPKVSVVDLAGWICPRDRCIETMSGVALRTPDPRHYRAAGAHFVARWIVPKVIYAAHLRR